MSGGADDVASTCSADIAAIFCRRAGPHGGFGAKPTDARRPAQRAPDARPARDASDPQSLIDKIRSFGIQYFWWKEVYGRPAIGRGGDRIRGGASDAEMKTLGGHDE